MAESENICKNPWKIYGGGKFVNKLTIKVQGKEFDFMIYCVTLQLIGIL